MTDDPRAELAERLEPCPFCSGTADFGTRPNQKTMWSVHCDYCTAYRVGETQEEAIAAWNTRAALSQPEAGAVKDAYISLPITTEASS